MIAVDTNILVHAHRRESSYHSAAATLVRGLAEGRIPWAIPWPRLYEFHSVVTNPRIWKGTATCLAANLRLQHSTSPNRPLARRRVHRSTCFTASPLRDPTALRRFAGMTTCPPELVCAI